MLCPISVNYPDGSQTKSLISFNETVENLKSFLYWAYRDFAWELEIESGESQVVENFDAEERRIMDELNTYRGIVNDYFRIYNGKSFLIEVSLNVHVLEAGSTYKDCIMWNLCSFGSEVEIFSKQLWHELRYTNIQWAHYLRPEAKEDFQLEVSFQIRKAILDQMQYAVRNGTSKNDNINNQFHPERIFRNETEQEKFSPSFLMLSQKEKRQLARSEQRSMRQRRRNR